MPKGELRMKSVHCQGHLIASGRAVIQTQMCLTSRLTLFPLDNIERNILSSKNNSLGENSIRQNLFCHCPKFQQRGQNDLALCRLPKNS